MKYDVIIIGGGPGGLMAARTAAESGLKVILIERKRKITDTSRTDVSIFYFKFLIPDAYVEPVKVEIGASGGLMAEKAPRTRFIFPQNFSVDYTGLLVPYYNFINFSPSGHQVYSLKNEFWGFYYSREVFLADLLSEVGRVGAEVLTETLALGIENTPEGVKVRVRGRSGEQTLEGRKAIVADGVISKMVESMGLNENRSLLGMRIKSVSYVLEGVDVPNEVPDYCSWLTFTIPSIKRGSTIWLCNHSERDKINLKQLGGGNAIELNKFMQDSAYAPWFRHASVVRKTGFSIAPQTLLRKPVTGNALVVGDAAIGNETWIQGAVASGYQGGKAVLKELNGQDGYSGYTEWLQQAFAVFAFNDHFKLKNAHYILSATCSDEEIDYIYSRYKGEVGHPAFKIAENPEMIKDERPELFGRLKKAYAELDKMSAKGWDSQ
jgi:flavin-dependent dehydrogenase